MKSLSDKKIAIIYDWIDKWGGVERLLLTLHDMFPQATFYTSYYDEKEAIWAKDLNIKTSFIQKLPAFIRKKRIFSLFFYPYAFESFDLSEYDMVISVTSSFAKAVITKPHTVHISYILTPTRFVWVYPELYMSGPFSSIKLAVAEALRKWDYIAAQRPDHLLTLSHAVAKRCAKYYNRQAAILHPPFAIDYWQGISKHVSEQTTQPSQSSILPLINSKYFLVVSRLETYKNVEMVIRYFDQRPQETLVIVGKGTQKKYLQQLSAKNCIFLENLTDIDLAILYTHAQALIMPQEEDFGYVSLEAQYFDCPVIAYARGGAAETVIDGETGILFPQQSIDSLTLALERFKLIEYNERHSSQQEKEDRFAQFSETQFRTQLLNYISSIL